MRLGPEELAVAMGDEWSDANEQQAPLVRPAAAKRAMDLVLAMMALVSLTVMLVMIALAIKLDSRGPVFFRQTRRGLRGKPFRIIKFRTMMVCEDGAVVEQAKRGDRRVTRVGRWLRRTSLDELPQLFNVLQGDMSLVGPRPHAVAHDDYYGRLIDGYETRQVLRPGITGWSQVNGARGETPEIADMQRRIELDLWYVRNWSLLLDVQILVRTVAEVMRSRTAF